MGIEGLRDKFESWEGDKEQYAISDEDNQGGVDIQLPQIIAEEGNKAAISVEENGNRGNLDLVQDSVGPEIRIGGGEGGQNEYSAVPKIGEALSSNSGWEKPLLAAICMFRR